MAALKEIAREYASEIRDGIGWVIVYHTTDPKKAKPFIQPTMAEDSYQKGEVCLWTDGKVYRSIMETANAYSPADYPDGWEVVEVEDGGAA